MDDLTVLLIAARDGDALAFARVVRAVQADVWRLACHLSGTDDADDVTQDTLVRVWRALPSYRVESSGRTWVLSIARRACADAVRSRMRRRKLVVRLGARRESATIADTTEVAGLAQLVDRLEIDRREAFVLTQVLGCSYADTAGICGVPIGTIRSRVARAREDLVVRVRAAEAI